MSQEILDFVAVIFLHQPQCWVKWLRREVVLSAMTFVHVHVNNGVLSLNGQYATRTLIISRVQLPAAVPNV